MIEEVVWQVRPARGHEVDGLNGAQSDHVLVAALVTIDPILLFQSTFIMTETFATFLAVVGMWMLLRYHERLDTRSAALAGIVGSVKNSQSEELMWTLGSGLFDYLDTLAATD